MEPEKSTSLQFDLQLREHGQSQIYLTLKSYLFSLNYTFALIYLTSNQKFDRNKQLHYIVNLGKATIKQISQSQPCESLIFSETCDNRLIRMRIHSNQIQIDMVRVEDDLNLIHLHTIAKIVKNVFF